MKLSMTGPARLRTSAGPGRAVTAQDFSWAGPGRYGQKFGWAGPDSPARPKDLQPWCGGLKSSVSFKKTRHWTFFDK